MLHGVCELIETTEKKELLRKLSGDEESLMSRDFELVVRHMSRVSSGVSESIETSALHVELLALYRRTASILLNAARSA